MNDLKTGLAIKCQVRFCIGVIENIRLCAGIDGRPDTRQAVNLSKRWKNATFEEKRGVCRILIERIIIDNDDNA